MRSSSNRLSFGRGRAHYEALKASLPPDPPSVPVSSSSPSSTNIRVQKHGVRDAAAAAYETSTSRLLRNRHRAGLDRLEMQAPPSQLQFSLVPESLKRVQELAKRDVSLGLRYGTAPWAYPQEEDVEPEKPSEKHRRRHSSPRRSRERAYSLERVEQHRRKSDRGVGDEGNARRRRNDNPNKPSSNLHVFKKAVVKEAKRVKRKVKRVSVKKPAPLEDELDHVPSREVHAHSTADIPEEEDADESHSDEPDALRAQVQTILDDVKEELKVESKTLLEKEIYRQAALDAGEARASAAIQQAQQSVLDVVKAGKREIEKHLQDQFRNPNEILRDAQAQAASFRSTLLPLLEEAEQRVHQIQGSQMSHKSPFLNQLSTMSARHVTKNVDVLSEMMLDSLLEDTARLLNQLEEDARKRKFAFDKRDSARTGLIYLDQFEDDIERVSNAIKGCRVSRNHTTYISPQDAAEEKPVEIMAHVVSEAKHLRDETDDDVAQRGLRVVNQADAEIARLSRILCERRSSAVAKVDDAEGEDNRQRIDDIVHCRAEFRRHAERLEDGLYRQAGIRPWQLVHLVSEEIVEECMEETAREISSCCDGIISNLIQTELQPMPELEAV